MTFSLPALRRALVAVALASLCAALLTAPNRASAVTLVQDPDRNSQSLTGWGWHTNVSAATVSSYVSQGNRIIDLEVNASTPTFSAAYVKNSGAYARTWWWYYGKTSSQVSSLLTTNGARLIDIEPYSTSSGIRYAVVMVKNTGAAAKAWAWKYGATVSSIAAYASANNMRVIDTDRYSTSSGDRFTALFIRNTGVDAKGWWHYYNVSSAQVSGFLTTNNARLIDLERLSNGNYDVVMQSRGSEYWWWLLGQSVSQLQAAANQLGARIYKIEPYVVSGVRRYNALLINDVNSETTRIRQLVSGQMTGPWGFYLKKVGGSDLLGIGQDNVFEPASMIKIVHAVTAMRDIQLNATTKDTLRTWYAHPSYPARYPTSTGYRTASTSDTDHADVCAYNSDTGALLTGATYSDKLGSVLIKQTLVYSDNRTTDGLTRYYGFSGLNNTASLAGMTSSKVNHRIGCPGKASPQPVTHNRLTLRDAGRIYEKVQNLTLLNAAHRDLLYSYMLGGPIGDGALEDMIRSEATTAGLTALERDQFVANVVTRSKGGSYGYCPNFDGSGTCDPPTAHSRTVGGVIWLPFKTGTGIIGKIPYAYGRYWDAQLNCSFASVKAGSCASFNNNGTGMGTVSVEMFRAEVKKALATW